MGMLSLEQPHGFSKDDALARMKALGEYFQNKHGIGVTWAGDVGNVSGKYMVVTIEGKLSVAEKRVTFEGKDPGMLWRGKAKDYISGKIQKYLDPSTTLEALPRR